MYNQNHNYTDKILCMKPNFKPPMTNQEKFNVNEQSENLARRGNMGVA